MTIQKYVNTIIKKIKCNSKKKKEIEKQLMKIQWKMQKNRYRII